MTTLKQLRVVIASPNDVELEREALDIVIKKVNDHTAEPLGLTLRAVRWETDAFPGFHVDGPQGLIDPILNIQDCDVFIGIFWRRFGTPTKDGKTGTEHEFQKAYEAWKRNIKPQIMFYFSKKPYSPKEGEPEQQAAIFKFKKEFPKEGLYWEYESLEKFKENVEDHLTKYIQQEARRNPNQQRMEDSEGKQEEIDKSTLHPNDRSYQNGKHLNFSNEAQKIIGDLDGIIKDTDGNELNGEDNLETLITLGIKSYEKIEPTLEDNTKEKAYASLWNATFISLRESLKATSRLIFKGDESRLFIPMNYKKVMDELLKLFKEDSKWNCRYLPHHPAIERLKSEIGSHLKEKIEMSSKIIKYFHSKFDIEFEKNLDDNAKKHFFPWWDQASELTGYLDYVQGYKEYLKNPYYPEQRLMQTKLRPLFEYYVQQNVFSAYGTEDWYKKDEDLSEDEEERSDIFVDDTIHSFLNRHDPNKAARVTQLIVAPFGIGKTSIMRMIASEYARRCLYTSAEINGLEQALHDNSTYIPILVYLRDGFDHVYENNSLKDILDDIVCAKKELCDRNVLLILDGLDEYVDTVSQSTGALDSDNLDKYIFTLLKDVLNREKYPHIKVIVTTRNHPELPSRLGIKYAEGHYLRLLPFNGQQMNEFLYSYFNDAHDLAYVLKQFESLREEEKKFFNKPLFIWMFSLLNAHTEARISFKDEWSTDAKTCLLYLFFIHHLLRGKYKVEGKMWLTKKQNSWKNFYIAEKKSLRAIAILRHVTKSELPLLWGKNLEQQITNLGINIDNLHELMPLLASYFYYNDANELAISFIHKTFQEYLIAEFYLENMLQDKIYKLNIKSPSENTIKFFLGLIDLLILGDEPDIKKLLVSNDPNEPSLLASFDVNGLQDAKDRLDKLVGKITNNPFYFNVEDEKVKKVDQLWREINLSEDDVTKLSINKWVSLLLLNRIVSQDNVEKPEHLVKFLRYFSATAPRPIIKYLKLCNINLSGTDISDTNLANIDFRGAKFHNTILSHTNFTEATLSGVEFTSATLTGADLTNTTLTGADLTGADLTKVKFNKDTFSKANIQNTYCKFR